MVPNFFFSTQVPFPWETNGNVTYGSFRFLLRADSGPVVD